MNKHPKMTNYFFLLTEENKWKLKEVSAIWHMEENAILNMLIGDLHETVLEKRHLFPSKTNEKEKEERGEKQTEREGK